jgi:hypothetical protein
VPFFSLSIVNYFLSFSENFSLFPYLLRLGSVIYYKRFLYSFEISHILLGFLMAKRAMCASARKSVTALTWDSRRSALVQLLLLFPGKKETKM